MEEGNARHLSQETQAFLEQPELRVEDLESLCPGVNRRTLQRDLQSLVERGVLKSSGAARLVKYRLKIMSVVTKIDGLVVTFSDGQNGRSSSRSRASMASSAAAL